MAWAEVVLTTGEQTRGPSFGNTTDPEPDDARPRVDPAAALCRAPLGPALPAERLHAPLCMPSGAIARKGKSPAKKRLRTQSGLLFDKLMPWSSDVARPTQVWLAVGLPAARRVVVQFQSAQAESREFYKKPPGRLEFLPPPPAIRQRTDRTYDQQDGGGFPAKRPGWGGELPLPAGGKLCSIRRPYNQIGSGSFPWSYVKKRLPSRAARCTVKRGVEKCYSGALSMSESPGPSESTGATQSCWSRVRKFTVDQALAMTGWRWEADDKEKRSEIGSLITAFIFLFAGVLGAIVAEQGKGRRPWILVGYILVGVVVVGIIAGINRANKPGKGQGSARMFRYDSGTKWIGQLLFAASALLLIGFLFLWYFERLPGQQPVALAAGAAETIDKLPSGLPGLALYVPMQPAHFQGTLPSDCTLEVTLGDQASKAWTLVRAVVYEYSETGARLPDALYAPVCGASAQGQPSKVRISGLAPDARYRVKLSLEPKGCDVSEYISTPDGDQKDKLLEGLKKKYKPIALEARRSLTARGAVILSAKPGVEEEAREGQQKDPRIKQERAEG